MPRLKPTPIAPDAADSLPPMRATQPHDHRALTRRAAEPMYRQLAAQLREAIAAGHLAPGAQLDSEAALMARYGVSRVTVRQATTLLRTEGALIARRGKGTFVVERVLHQDLDALQGFYDAVRSQGIEPVLQLLEFATIPASARDPQVPDGLPVRLQRLYSVDGRPFALGVGHVPAAAAALGRERAERLTVYQIVEQYLSIRIARADVTIRCQKAPRAVAARLGLRTGEACLVMARCSRDAAGAACEFMRIYIVPERYEFHLRVPGSLDIASSIHRVERASAQRTD